MGWRGGSQPGAGTAGTVQWPQGQELGVEPQVAWWEAGWSSGLPSPRQPGPLLPLPPQT